MTSPDDLGPVIDGSRNEIEVRHRTVVAHLTEAETRLRQATSDRDTPVGDDLSFQRQVEASIGFRIGAMRSPAAISTNVRTAGATRRAHA